jgi:hypothetical protein
VSLLLETPGEQRVRLDDTPATVTIEDANGNTIELASAGITATDVSGNEIKTSGAGVEVSAPTINLKGNMVTVAGAGGEPLVKGNMLLAMFNSHVHTTTAPGAPTSPPVVPLTPAVLTTASTAK